MGNAQLDVARREKDRLFKHSSQSPLTPEQQDKFTSLSYYDYNADLDLKLTIEPIADGKFISLQTTTGDARQFKRYGRFSFSVEGQEVELTLYEADYGFFLPFVDAGAGTETYPAGRYLEPEYLGDNRFHIDFNNAYNPYCAYGEGWSCPITPAENRLKVNLRAGEKMPEGGWAAG